MASDTPQSPGMKADGADPGQGEPSFAWSEGDLRAFLARAWGQPSSNIRVIGRVRMAVGKPHGYLEDLHHPDTGLRLPPPTVGSRVHQSVYVPSSEVRAFHDRRAKGTFALAELELSPLEERTRRGDPFACMVRPRTLEPFSAVPESWLKVLEAESGPLVLSSVRQALEEQLGRETSDAEEELREVRRTLETVALEKRALEDELGRIAHDVSRQKERVAALDAEFEQRRIALENKQRELETLFRDRGERLVALGIIDRAQLEKVIPPLGRTDERGGHHFREALGGDFRRLASYIQAHLWRRDIHYTRAQLLDFLTLLRTRDLIVLAGDSGSGKTSLVKSVASAIGGKCKIIPVKPNWTSSEDLLGYYNPIEHRFQPSPFLEALLDARHEPEVPHFICLDEMNLARVEYYFADFLSLLETRAEAPWIHLYSTVEERETVADNRIFLELEAEARRRAGLPGDASLNDILLDDQASLELRKLAGLKESEALLDRHAKLRRSLSGLIEIPTGFAFPPNVWIIGAINVDETTHYLSPKVLDRAHVMRFRNPVLVEWGKVERELEPFDLDLALPMNLVPSDLGLRTEYPAFDQDSPQAKRLVQLARDHLDPLGIEFGLRAIRQSLHYIRLASESSTNDRVALNNVALHKVLPKIITIDVEKAVASGQKRGEVLVGLRDALAVALEDMDRAEVTESAVESLDALIARAAGNNGIANFWTR